MLKLLSVFCGRQHIKKTQLQKQAFKHLVIQGVQSVGHVDVEKIRK